MISQYHADCHGLKQKCTMFCFINDTK